MPTSFVLSTLTCESGFHYIRCILLNKPTISEYQIASRIAKTINIDSEEEVDNLLVKARLRKQAKFDNNLIIHYTHEKQLQSNKKIFINYGNKYFNKHQSSIPDLSSAIKTVEI